MLCYAKRSVSQLDVHFKKETSFNIFRQQLSEKYKVRRFDIILIGGELTLPGKYIK